MAGASKKKRAEKYRGWYVGEDGRRRYFTGTTDRKQTLEIARKREADARLVREGLVPRGESRRREAALRRVADHVEDYRRHLLAKGDTDTHANHTAGAILRVLADAGTSGITDVRSDQVQAALGRLRAVRSARTVNHALGAVKGFLRWLDASERIESAPRGVLALKPFNERTDRKRQRRALSVDELAKLYEAAESGPTVVTRKTGRGGKPTGTLTGAERAILYRLAVGTGFRANELRSLTPESFDLGESPTVTVHAAYSKRKRDDAQPISRALAELLRPWLAGKPPGVPVLAVPEKTAELLRDDLARAGIAPEADGKVVDFHSLRHTFISGLIERGVDPKTVQELARHSTITLTIDRYSHSGDERKRRALEGGEP